MQPQNISNYVEQESDDNLLSNLFFKYLSYWPVFIVLALISFLVAGLYIHYKVPIYQVNATLLIKDERKGLDDSKVMDALDIFGPKKIVENETVIVHSYTMAEEVVKNLRLYAPITQEGKVVNRSAYLTSPIQIEAKVPDSVQRVKKVYFSYNSKQQQVVLDKRAYSINQWVTTPYGVLRFLPNKFYQAPDEEYPLYFSLVPVKTTADNIVKALEVAPISKQSTVINLSINDEVPQRGQDILNELIAAYNRASILDKNALAANTLSFVEERLKYVVQELDSVEGKLQQFKASNRITDISAQGQLFLQTVGTNDQKISDISMQEAVLDNVEAYVLGKGSKSGIVPSTLGVQNPMLSQLLEKLYDAEVEYEKTRKVAPENNPAMIALADEIAKIRPSILESIRNERRSLQAGKADLNNTNSKYNSLLQTIPEKERQLLSISRQQVIKNNIYTFLLQKREEAALSLASAVSDSRLIDKARSSEKPVSPKKMTVIALSLAVALGLGIAFISFKEIMARNIQTRAEVEKYTSVPILGELMQDSSKNPIVIGEGKRTFVAEQFRQLRTSLGYLGINSRKKKILLTSNISGEGKSFIAANLGLSLALMGKKVVLLELDLRKPKLSDSFNVSRSVGITNYLIEQKEAEQVIKSTGYDNLFIIPSGPIPPNPTELILNGKIEGLFSYLESIFDYIIIDTSPVNPVTDAYILSPYCDATLFVVRHEYTPKMFIKKLDEINKIRSLKNMAIVYNGIKANGLGRYGYGSAYGYGYGYTDEKSEKKKKGVNKTS